jgi:hypothetical protein
MGGRGGAGKKAVPKKAAVKVAAVKVVEAEPTVEKETKPLKPAQCRTHMRKTLAKEFDEIVKGFVTAAKKGSCQHVKLATELLKPTRKPTTRKKGPVAKLLEELGED